MKKIAISIVLLVLVVGGVAAMLGRNGKTKNATATPTPKPKLTAPPNQIPISERPYVTIEPTAVREVVLSIGELKKSADSVDFELQYSAGDKEEAAIGSVNLSSSPPYTKTILLGSKSGGGKITYHENVTGGTLVLSFFDENYKLSNEWSYIDNKKPQTEFSSRDAKFQMTTAKLLNKEPYVIVYNNPGLPKNVDKTILAGPYSVSTTSRLPDGKVSLSIRLSDEKPAQVLGWTGKDWKTFVTKTDGKTATATVDILPTYLVVEQ